LGVVEETVMGVGEFTNTDQTVMAISRVAIEERGFLLADTVGRQALYVVAKT
jgi:hypothetical protein